MKRKIKHYPAYNLLHHDFFANCPISSVFDQKTTQYLSIFSNKKFFIKKCPRIPSHTRNSTYNPKPILSHLSPKRNLQDKPAESIVSNCVKSKKTDN